MSTRRSISTACLAAGALGAALAMPSAAHAWWRGGLFIGLPPALPFFYAPPPVVYAPPPVVYAPPAYGAPAYAPPPSGAPAYQPYGYAQPGPSGPAASAAPGSGAGPACYAGAYICPLDRPLAAGAPCSCPTNTGRAGGRVG